MRDTALKLRSNFKEELPFLTIGIRILEKENINHLIKQFPTELFKEIGCAYNYDNLYFFVLPEYLEKLFLELDKVDAKIVECLGFGFFDKAVKKDLLLDMFLFYEKKKARKGTVKVNIPELHWLSEPIFLLEEGKEIILRDCPKIDTLINK